MSKLGKKLFTVSPGDSEQVLQPVLHHSPTEANITKQGRPLIHCKRIELKRFEEVLVTVNAFPFAVIVFAILINLCAHEQHACILSYMKNVYKGLHRTLYFASDSPSHYFVYSPTEMENERRYRVESKI